MLLGAGFEVADAQASPLDSLFLLSVILMENSQLLHHQVCLRATMFPAVMIMD